MQALPRSPSNPPRFPITYSSGMTISLPSSRICCSSSSSWRTTWISSRCWTWFAPLLRAWSMILRPWRRFARFSPEEEVHVREENKWCEENKSVR
jgi:hypothetical protein